MSWLAEFMAAERLPEAFALTVEKVCAPLAEQIAAGPPRQVVGVCGSQASGKSTITVVVRRMLERKGLQVALFSLDDLYLTHAERQALARDVHPLFATRGVPGTHDVALGEALIEALQAPGETAIPAFDKASDDRRPQTAWPRFEGPADVVLFEGWCVGARPQAQAELAAPVNDLERERDPDGTWRRRVNAELAGAYQRLFARLTSLVLLQASNFEVVLGWRLEQEHKLRDRVAREGGDGARVMSDQAVEAFIRHYERLTRHILAHMPEHADVVVKLGPDRRPL
jgi:D-glycerate 3-kinase